MIDLKTIRERAQAAARIRRLEPLMPVVDIVDLSGADVPALLDLVDAMTGALLRAAETCPCGAGCGVDHVPSCQVDAVLARAGYPDQVSRDAERARRKLVADKAKMADVMKVVELARMGDTSAQKILEADGVDWRAPPPVAIPEAER